MGLNWNKGLEGASKGMETILGVQAKSIEMQYDDIVRKNNERFKQSERVASQEFTSSERETKDEFTTSERESKQTFEAGESKMDREIRAKELDMRGRQLDDNEEYRRGQLELSGERNEISREKGTGEGGYKSTSELVKDWDERIAELEADEFGDVEKNAAMIAALKAEKSLANTYPKTYREFKMVQESMQGHPDTQRYASTFASISDDDRDAIDQAKAGYIKQGLPIGAAYMRAIDDFMGASEAKAPSAEAPPPNTGTIDSGVEQKTVTGGVKTPQPKERGEEEILAEQLAAKFEDAVSTAFIGAGGGDKDVVLNKLKKSKREMYLNWAKRIISGEAKMPDELSAEAPKFAAPWANPASTSP